MSNTEDHAGDYLDAANRKIEMARYHLDALRGELGDPKENSQASISVQAYFEGVLYVWVAAADQTAEAINLIYVLGLENPNLQLALEHMPDSKLRSRMFKWQQAPIAADVRDIRRRATHHHYEKTPEGPRLQVQDPTGAKPYPGSRSLEDYATAAVDHLENLRPFLRALQGEFVDRRNREAVRNEPQ
jgi:hypothetical protein